jgi:hypothetical protein
MGRSPEANKMGEAERLGTLLGLIAREGMPAFQDAIAALKKGEATPRQQRLCYLIIEASSK